MKKIIALVLALTMVLMAVSAFAADPAYDSPITISGLVAGDVAHFYKVIEWAGTTSSEGTDVAGWKATSAFESILTPEVLRAVLVGDPNADPAVAPTGITPELAGELARAASGAGETVTVGSDSTTATYQNASEGMWMALITPYDANTVYNPIFVSADYDKSAGHEGTVDASTGSIDGVAKKSELTITKEAANPDDYNGDNAQTTAVKDTVTYTVTATIPGYGEIYEHPHYVMTDTLTNLTFQEMKSISVDEGNYTLTTSASGFTITFSESYLKTVLTATEVTVVYTAKVADDAPYAITEEDNEVMIEYSHNPNNESDYDVKKDTTQHYTFTIDAAGLGNYTELSGKKTSEVVKTGQDAAGNPILTEAGHTEIIDDPVTWEGPLEGAQFGLWKASDSTCEGTPYLTATTTADGRMKFEGLDEGTYYLKEIQAPTGYVTNTDIHTVVLNADFDTVTVTEYYDASTDSWYPENNSAGTRKSATYETQILSSYSVTIDTVLASSYTFTNASTASSNDIKWTTLDPVELPHNLINIKGVELPSTGGIGTTIFYILGGLLVVGAVVILVARRKAQD